jgi:hypothetical protein
MVLIATTSPLYDNPRHLSTYSPSRENLWQQKVSIVATLSQCAYLTHVRAILLVVCSFIVLAGRRMNTGSSTLKPLTAFSLDCCYKSLKAVGRPEEQFRQSDGITSERLSKEHGVSPLLVAVIESM